jgi:hypothetical protein
VIQLRKKFSAAALMTAAAMMAVTGCSGRDDETDPDPIADAGCVGVCSADAGTDAGTDAGGTRVCPGPVNGRGPIGQLRDNGTRGQAVTLDEVVVVAVSQTTRGSQGDFIARFWVVDTCFPKEGIFVDKFYQDVTTNYEPQVGDVLSIQGLFRRFNATARDGAPNERDAYRPVIKSDFQLGQAGITGRLVITKRGTTTPPADSTVPAGFGNSDGGAGQPNPDFGGSRVYLPGPITITNATPTAMKLRPEDPDSGTYLGFEVSGGVLVANYKTFNTCDWRATVADGGSVTFQNGIRGVWDTYSNVPCLDGGTDAGADGGTFFQCTQEGNGVVPGTTNPYTYVLYPMDCGRDLPGDAGTP